MAITDLTGTKWKLNNLPLSANDYYNFDINFISNETNYTHLSVEFDHYYEFQLRYDGILVYDGGGGHTDPHWVDEAYKKIEIIDGADVTDADLITKLQQWGVQPLTVTYTNVKPVTDPTYTYTGNFYSDEVSYLDVQQNETKYYEYTLNFDTDGGTLGEYDPPSAAPQLYQFYDEYYIQDSGYWQAGYQHPIPANTFTQDITARASWILTNIYYENAYFTLPTCEKADNIFNGWLYTNKLGVSRIYNAGDEFIPSEDDSTEEDFTLNFTALYTQIIYTPFDSNFIGFSLYPKEGNTRIFHSIMDLNIYRVSDGSRYNENLRPTFQDQTSTVQGGDGTYYFGTTFQNRQITLQIAFDNVNEVQRKKLITQMCDKTPKWLILDEMPYKKWLVVPNGAPSIKWVCFNQGPDRRIYKGEGTLQFISYNPYAISRYRYIDEYTLDNIPEWVRFFTIYSYEGNRSEEAYNEIETPLIRNYDYLSTEYLGQQQYTFCPFEIFQNIDMPVYYVDWGNKKEWQNIIVSLKTSGEVTENDTSSIKGIYNPGDIPTEPIIKFQVDGLQGIYECAIDSVRMRFDASKIIEITNSDPSIAKYIIDNKQHLFYAADNNGNLLYYLNDAITTGDFFMIDPMEEVNEFELNGANITNLEIDYKYLYY